MPDVGSTYLDSAQNAILATATNYYLSLHTADPGGTGASEGTSYGGRQTVQFAASSSGTQHSNTAQSFTITTSQTFTYFGVWTAATGGTFIRGGSLTASITPPAASTVTVASGGITFTTA